MVSCFVSYTAADSAWAEWIADTLRTAGHQVVVQATDFLPGDNFVLRMQRAASECDHTIVVLSESFMESRFGAAEWASAFAQDPTGERRRLIPIAVDGVRPTGLWSSIIRLDIKDLPEDSAREKVLEAVAPSLRAKPSFPGGGVASMVRPSGPRVDVWRLSSSPTRMIGRADESQILTNAWLSNSDNVVAIVGWGGAGKTTLVANWLAEIATRRYEGAENVFAWSFDGQSEGEQWATSDRFFAALINFLEIEGVSSSTTWERCREATQRLQETRSLVILDGLERIQNPPGMMESAFRERSMQMFIRELAALNAGMLILTSRLSIIDIETYVGKTCQSIQMPELARTESIEILKTGGVSGDVFQLDKIAEEVRDHPLSLRLLSGYLQAVFDGDARMWESSGLAEAIRGEGGNAKGIMDQYVSWFENKPELQLLQLLGLFNRQATLEELSALREPPICNGLNDQLAHMSRADIAYALGSLRRAGLIQNQAARKGIDAHPLVRQYFQQKFRQASPSAFQEGHRRLRDLLSSTSTTSPRTLEESAPTISAIWHGTRAGDNRDALAKLYLPRLDQGHHFLRDGLGAAASNHAALSYLLEDTGGEPLDSAQTSRLLGDQSLDLRMMGNTVEAVSPLLQAIKLTRLAEGDLVLINQLRHLSQLELALARVNDACIHILESLRITRRVATNMLEGIATQTSCAYTLLHAGRYDEAKKTLVESDLLKADATTRCSEHAARLTFCIAIYRAIDTILDLAEIDASKGTSADPATLASIADDILGVAKRAVNLSSVKPGLLGVALLELAAERVFLQAEKARTPSERLYSSVEDIRAVGQRPWIIEANLVKCRALHEKNPVEALKALAIAERLSRGDGMILQTHACRIERAKAERSSESSSLMATSISDIANSAARLGLKFIEDQTAQLT